MIAKRTCDIPIYGGQLTVILCDKPEDVEEALDIEFEDGRIPLRNVGGGWFFHDDCHHLMIPRGCGPGVIAHECKHFVNALFMQRGVELDPENDEPECYMLGWAVETVCDIIREVHDDR